MCRRLAGPSGTVAILELFRPSAAPGPAEAPSRRPAEYHPPPGGLINPWTDIAAAV